MASICTYEDYERLHQEIEQTIGIRAEAQAQPLLQAHLGKGRLYELASGGVSVSREEDTHMANCQQCIRQFAYLLKRSAEC